MSYGMMFGKAFDAFISTFKKSPIKTSVTLVAFFILVFIGSAKNLKDSEDLIEYRNLRDTTYSQQIEQLNKIENDMKSLLIFISNQKSNIEENKNSLAKITSERAAASELLNMDKEQVELIFLEQEKRQREARWQNWFEGIAMGVVASLMTSLIWNMFHAYKRKNV